MHHVFACAVIGIDKTFPPIAQLVVDFLRVTAQKQKIKAGTKARVVHQAEWVMAVAAFKAWLHEPNIVHIADVASLDRQLFCLLF